MFSTRKFNRLKKERKLKMKTSTGSNAKTLKSSESTLPIRTYRKEGDKQGIHPPRLTLGKKQLDPMLP